MMQMLLERLFLVVDTLVFIYVVTICSFYLFLAVFSISEMRRYLHKNFKADYKQILASPFSPSISIIAPAYNEGATIIQNVRSMLSLEYNNFDLIIVNDGSKDDSIAKLIERYDLVKVAFDYREKIPTKPIRAIYKSKNRSFKKLMVVDKENGGKADALNVGLNISDKELVACVDVDCIIETDALLKMVKPYMESNKEVIATGGVIRIANNCVVEDGRLVEVHLPKNIWARFQVLEYIRAFLLGRMAWSRLNGLMLISGAFGLFKKDVAIAAGGYNTKTVGEDMELVVRMRTYMTDKKRPHQVVYVPDPLCWTEAPSSLKVLGRQRNRWTRGTFETLKMHKYLFFNPRYGLLGMLSYPFWFFFEWLAPIVEVLGLIYFIVLCFLGDINWLSFWSLMLMVYTFALFISSFALLSEENSYYKYTQQSDMGRMFLLALIEPFFYHPLTVYWAVMGNIDKLKGKHTWGEMTRTGFIVERKKVKS